MRSIELGIQQQIPLAPLTLQWLDLIEGARASRQRSGSQFLRGQRDLHDPKESCFGFWKLFGLETPVVSVSQQLQEARPYDLPLPTFAYDPCLAPRQDVEAHLLS